MDENEITKIIKLALEAKSPINVEGDLMDLEDFTTVFEDGKWNSRGFSYLYNKKTKALVYYWRSNWQGESSRYSLSTWDKFVVDMLGERDVDHFERYIDGLRAIYKKPQPRQSPE